MITPELLGYIRGELGKGRTREEVQTELMKSGGWKEDDLSEAFRIVIPMQGFFAPTGATSETLSPSLKVQEKSPRKFPKRLIFTVFGLACVALLYFYYPQAVNFWKGAVESLPKFSMPSFDFGRITGFFGGSGKDEASGTIMPAESAVAPLIIKDCGTSVAPDLKNPPTYQNAVLTCLGNSALACAGAKAVLNDSLFPTIFQIVRGNSENQNTCSFRLSYAGESALVDATGKRLAGQYITCPVDVVKMVNESTDPLSFEAPSKSNSGLYAGQIYFYGILGLFMENDVDKSKILGLGCSGPYIDSVVASYKAR